MLRTTRTFQENPFRKRICRVFSSDESGKLTFDQFVLMYSIFSEKSPREMKVHYAFKIYGQLRTIFFCQKQEAVK